MDINMFIAHHPIFIVIPVFFTLVFAFTYRSLGIRGIIKGGLKGLLLSSLGMIGTIVIMVVYPIVPDYWKLAVVCLSFFFTMPFAFLFWAISESISNDRKQRLFRLGFREVTRDDFVSFDDYLNRNVSKEIYRSDCGICDLDTAEKLVNKEKRIVTISPLKSPD